MQGRDQDVLVIVAMFHPHTMSLRGKSLWKHKPGPFAWLI